MTTAFSSADGQPAVDVPMFVGRVPELAAVTSALAGAPALVLLEGEAGIGKSRLLVEYLAGEAGREHRPLVAYCPPFRQPHTLGPIVDAVRQSVGSVRGLRLSALGGALRPLFPEWAADLPPALEAAEDASAARARVFGALDELLGCLQVSLLVVEDVHWADEATLEFLLFLSSRLSRRFHLVVTSRPEDVADQSLLLRLTSRLTGGGRGYRITLGPLDEEATAGLVSSMLSGEHVSGEFAAFVHERTEGVPLAVEECLRVLLSRAELVRRDDGWVRKGLATIQVPPTIRDGVLERAGGLGVGARAVLMAAAVLAEPAGETTVGAVAGLSATAARQGLAAAIGCGLLAECPAGLAGFRHALACQAVYEAIPGPDRRVFHLRAGQALENACPLPVARLARHFQAAAATDKWLEYGERAADVALASGDEAAAGVLLHDLITKAALPAEVVARLAGKLLTGALPGQASLHEVAGALTSVLATGTLADEAEAEVRLQLGQALLDNHEWAKGRAEIERAVPHLRRDSFARAWAMVMLGHPHGTTCSADDHAAWLRRAAELPSPREPADRLRLAVARVTALAMLGKEEGWTEAAQIPLRAQAVREWRHISLAHLNLGDQALRWGRYGEAAWRLDRALEIAGRYGYQRRYDDATVTRMHLDWLTGRWDGLARKADRLSCDPDVRALCRLEAALVAGLLDAASGAQARAEERLRRVLAETGRRVEMEYNTETAAALARLWLADGRVREALEVTQSPIGIIAGKGIWVWASDLAPVRVAVLAAAGRVGEASDLVTAFARGLGDLDAPAPQAGLITARAMLAEATGEHARAAPLFGCAASAWQALPRPYDALLARERQATCLLAAGREQQGLALLPEVLHELSRLGARGDAVRVMERLRQHGVEVKRPWWAGRQGYGDQLSPREVEVVRLLAEGQSNRQIGEALFLSPRTVERHVYRAMRKLSVNSRAALAAVVIAAGIVPAKTSLPG